MQAGVGATACEAIDEMGKMFQVDALQMKFDVLQSLSSQTRVPVDHQWLAGESLELVKDAVAKDAFDLARELAKITSSESRKVGDRDLA